MNNRHHYSLSFLTLSAALAFVLPASADPGRITVHTDKPGAAISPLLYGLMTEEINHAYDGGLYGELIQNRALEDDPQQPAHWSAVTAATLALDTDAPPNTALTASLRIDIASASAARRAGAANDGYWGIPLRPNTTYHASFYARATGIPGPLTVSLESGGGSNTYASAKVSRVTTEWNRYTVTLKTGKATPTASARFTITASSPGTLWLTQVSLFPPTYKNRPNGNRVDLMEKLAALKPAMLRFPGGNYLEGDTITTRFDWKKTLGPIENRPGHMGPWGYRSTDGLGMAEFLGWCEDLHMEPLLAVYAGYSLNHYRNPNPEVVKPGPDLDPYVQDALDEIEYVSGDATTKWGAVRARNGHPAPFKLEYVEVGNEDWFDNSGSYDGRFAQFYDAIRAKYPNLKIIATTHVDSRTPDLYDEHYYRSPADMEKDATHYDRYDRNGPKVFVGEWASQEGNPTPDLNSALGDAAWMTGMERNSDIVPLSTYAPLLVNVNEGAAQWGTNLIGYDALNSFGSPSYYMQTMFDANRGDVVLPVDLDIPQPPVTVDQHPMGKVGVATWGTQAEFKDVQVTHDGQTLYAKDFATGDDDWKIGDGTWKTVDGVLQQSSDIENSRATVGDAAWGDYTLTLKARKTGGREGFLILFHDRDDANWAWWNIGGWGDTRTVIERSYDGNKVQIGRPSDVTVETGRWYDVKIEVEGPKIRCYLDGKLITEAVDAPPPPPASVYATASRDQASGDTILKVVNVAAAPQETSIALSGAKDVPRTAVVTVLSGQPGDSNTLDEPRKVVPQTSDLAFTGSTFDHTFPAHSVTVIRVKGGK